MLAVTLDEVAARAVPAWHGEDIDGWVARYSPGLSAKRVNSVWPREHDPGSPIEEKLAGVERFYSARDLPPRFQISPAAQPTGLDRALERRGYERGGPTTVELCGIGRLAGPPPARGIDVTIDRAQAARWSATWQASLGLSDARLAATTRLLGRVPNRVAFATVSVDGAPAGVGLGVLDGRWLGAYRIGPKLG